MTIELRTVGGYEEVGKNMTALKIGKDALIIDMGIHLENYIRYTEDEDILNITPEELIEVGAVPDISAIEDIKNEVKAIIPTHAHLDHLGGIPFLSRYFKAPILGSPFTVAVLNRILKDEKIRIGNRIIKLTTNSFYQITDDIKVEFINMTHSTLDTVMVAVHTKEGIIIYANDFKFDMTPVIGKKPNFAKLKELGKKGVKALIVDSTYAPHSKKMPSESVARELLKDVLLGTDAKGKAVIVTTFSSHLARLKSIISLGEKMNRKILFLGRSLGKYIAAGEEAGLVSFSKHGKIVPFSKQIKRELKKINNSRDKYLLVVTGHQGEPKAVLNKIAHDKLGLILKKEDHVVFSCTVIPTKTNIDNREKLEQTLKDKGVRIFRDIHVSGHAAREDLRDLLNLIKPEKIIPAHGDEHMKTALKDLAIEMGYKEEDILLMKDGERKILT